VIFIDPNKVKFNFLIKEKIPCKCKNPACVNIFEIKPYNPKKYCSSSCAAKVNNFGRVLSLKSKNKISLALMGRKNPRPKLAISTIICANPKCKKPFIEENWKRPKYCSNRCVMQVVGGKPTSPKAARGKAGVRLDIDNKTYFYSRWEANYARILNLLNVEWTAQPKVFRLKKQNYTPDFYLPKEKTYIEIKNFLSDYSKKRDGEFRELYPNLKLIMILKDDYLKLQEKYSPSIKEWEFS
jgi:hypothetical protein